MGTKKAATEKRRRGIRGWQRSQVFDGLVYLTDLAVVVGAGRAVEALDGKETDKLLADLTGDVMSIADGRADSVEAEQTLMSILAQRDALRNRIINRIEEQRIAVGDDKGAAPLFDGIPPAGYDSICLSIDGVDPEESIGEALAREAREGKR